MLKDQSIEVCWGATNRKWYENKGYSFTKYRGKMMVKAKDLPPMSNKKVIVTCDYCGEDSVKTFSDYTVSCQSVVKKDACKDCKTLKSSESVTMTYGVGHQSQLDWVIAKISEAERLSIEEVRKVFNDRNCELISEIYKNAKESLNYKCLSHPKEIQVGTLDNFKTKKYACDQCAEEGSIAKLTNTYSKIVESKGLKLINVFKSNNYTYLEIYCSKHNEISKVLASNAKKSKCMCRSCIYESISEQTRHDLDYVSTLFKTKSYELLNVEDYKNNISELKYICDKHVEVGVQTTNLANVSSATTCRKCKYESISKENHYLWKGGVSPLHNHLRDKINVWKRDSLIAHDFKCVVTSINSKDLVVHHTYNFAKILDETLADLSLDYRESISKYTYEELNSIEKVLLEKHYTYGLGVPVLSEIHNLFHQLYGKADNTIEQFEEFKDRYINGEFKEVV